MSVKVAVVDKMWKKLGWTIDDSRKDVHALLYVDGVLVLRTKRSHGANKLDGEIPHLIRKQMRLNQPQFREALDCPLTQVEYFRILREKQILPPTTNET